MTLVGSTTRGRIGRSLPEKELNIRQRRRLELIKNYDWEILYHSGKANMVADALSKKERLKMIMSFGEFIRDFEKMEIVVKVTGAGTEKLFEISMRKKNIKDTPDESTTKAKSTDEIKSFLDGRYICVSEAAWRLLGFNKHHHFPSIECSPVHMEDEKSVSFKPHDDLGYVAE
ncbi:hypothetical protein AgCh_006193 [Apium graveolens]